MSAKGFSEKAESGDIGDSISPTAMQLASSGCAVRRKRFIASGDSSYFPRSAYKVSELSFILLESLFSDFSVRIAGNL